MLPAAVQLINGLITGFSNHSPPAPCRKSKGFQVLNIQTLRGKWNRTLEYNFSTPASIRDSQVKCAPLWQDSKSKDPAQPWQWCLTSSLYQHKCSLLWTHLTLKLRMFNSWLRSVFLQRDFRDIWTKWKYQIHWWTTQQKWGKFYQVPKGLGWVIWTSTVFNRVQMYMSAFCYNLSGYLSDVFSCVFAVRSRVCWSFLLNVFFILLPFFFSVSLLCSDSSGMEWNPAVSCDCWCNLGVLCINNRSCQSGGGRRSPCWALPSRIEARQWFTPTLGILSQFTNLHNFLYGHVCWQKNSKGYEQNLMKFSGHALYHCMVGLFPANMYIYVLYVTPQYQQQAVSVRSGSHVWLFTKKEG